MPAAGALACCSALYGSPLAELVVGSSLHPGGLESTRQLLSAATLRPGARLLDAGCGPGASSRLAATEFGLLVDAVDRGRDVLTRAERRPTTGPIRWREADLLALPYPAATFDAVLAECVLSMVSRPAALAEFRRVLRPGGRLLLSDVEVAGDPLPALGAHQLVGSVLCVANAWRTGELEARLPAAGFVIERRWDWTEYIVALIDQVAARIGLITAAMRDLGLKLAALVGETVGDSDSLWREQAQRLADELRAAVRRGELRYVAVMARTRHG
jgi:arsenite methyltransferase